MRSADFPQALGRIEFSGCLIRGCEHSRKPAGFEHRYIGPRTDQTVHNAPAHLQRLRAVAAAVKSEGGWGFERKSKFAVGVEAVKLPQERIFCVSNFLACQRPAKEPRGFADHGDRL